LNLCSGIGHGKWLGCVSWIAGDNMDSPAADLYP
jgi:hypothetical protein